MSINQVQVLEGRTNEHIRELIADLRKLLLGV